MCLSRTNEAKIKSERRVITNKKKPLCTAFELQYFPNKSKCSYSSYSNSSVTDHSPEQEVRTFSLQRRGEVRVIVTIITGPVAMETGGPGS